MSQAALPSGENGGPELRIDVLPTHIDQRNHSTSHWAEGDEDTE